jgi:hypothetical protein
MNILSSVTFVGVASVIYRFKKTMSGAVVGLCAAVFAMTAVMVAANLLITPYYMGVTVADVVALLPKLLLPFNAIKAILNASLTFCLYKPLTTVLRRTGFGKQTLATERTEGTASRYRTLWVWLIGGSIAVASLCVIFFVLGGRLVFC